MKVCLYIVLLWILATGCDRNEHLTRQELIRQEIDKRVRQYIKSKHRECREESLNIAIRQTDSLLRINAVKYVEDSLKRPPLPAKPLAHFRPAPEDTIANKPFLKSRRDTVGKDTLPPIEQ